MLRGRNESPNDLPTSSRMQGSKSPESTEDQPYALDERPYGVTFEKPEQSIFLPYLLLHRIVYQPNRLVLVFSAVEILIEGRGLRTLYVGLCNHKIARVVEQGERYVQVADAAMHIAAIEVRIHKQANGDGSE